MDIPWQALPQEPQWLLLVAVSVQVLLQSEKPWLHTAAQVLLTQTAVALAFGGHAIPHCPQFVGSVLVSAQPLGHWMNGLTHW
jgi:hypothetical protein